MKFTGNGPASMLFHYKAFRVEDYFERIFLSYEMKMVKPDVAIFEKLLEETGIDRKKPFLYR